MRPKRARFSYPSPSPNARRPRALPAATVAHRQVLGTLAFLGPAVSALARLTARRRAAFGRADALELLLSRPHPPPTRPRKATSGRAHRAFPRGRSGKWHSRLIVGCRRCWRHSEWRAQPGPPRQDPRQPAASLWRRRPACTCGRDGRTTTAQGSLVVWTSRLHLDGRQIRNPKSEIRNPKSEIRNPKSEIRNPKSEIPIAVENSRHFL